MRRTAPGAPTPESADGVRERPPADAPRFAGARRLPGRAVAPGAARRDQGGGLSGLVVPSGGGASHAGQREVPRGLHRGDAEWRANDNRRVRRDLRKRSEVKDSHDRYANIEINYLLQRMESYRGLAILATHIKNGPDRASLRRLRGRAAGMPEVERPVNEADFPVAAAGTPAGTGSRRSMTLRVRID